MGRNYTDYVDYECPYDCKYPKGCPGHKMRLVSCRSSDTLYIEIDGKDYARSIKKISKIWRNGLVIKYTEVPTYDKEGNLEKMEQTWVGTVAEIEKEFSVKIVNWVYDLNLNMSGKWTDVK